MCYEQPRYRTIRCFRLGVSTKFDIRSCSKYKLVQVGTYKKLNMEGESKSIYWLQF